MNDTTFLKFTILTLHLHYQYKFTQQILEDNKETPLHIACRQSNENIVRLLIERGSDVNAKTISTFSNFQRPQFSSTMSQQESK